MRRHVILTGFVLCLCGIGWTQDPPAVVAVVGEENVTKEELARELALVTGRDILNNLIQEILVRQEIKRRKIVIPPDAVAGRMKARDFTLRKQSQNGGMIDQLEGATSLDARRRGIEVLLAMETMAKQDFGMHPEQPITNLKVAKWLKALRERAKIEGQDSGLPKGMYAGVNGEFISEEQFNKLLFLNSDRGEIALALERIIARKLVEQETQRLSVKLAPSDIDSELVRLERNIQRDPRNRNLTLADALRVRGTSPEELRSDPSFEARVGARKIIRSQITTANAQEFCERYKVLYGGGKVRARQIFVAVVDPQTGQPKGPTAQQEALEKITRVHNELKAGADFAKLAKKHSDDLSTRDKGGDLGFFPRYGLVRDPMAGAAFLLRKGELSGVLVSPLGYHIVQTTDVEEPPDVDFEKVKELVISDMVDLRYPEYMNKLRESGSVKVLYK